MRRAGVADHRRRPRQEVDDAVGQPGLAQDLHDVVRRQHRRVRRLPHDGAAHHRRRRRQVGADRREVERRDGEHEALERARLELVPHARRRERLLRRRCARRSAQFQRQKSIDSQAASISAWCAVFDWPSMVAALRIGAILRRQQLGRAQEDREPLVERRRRPRRLRRQRGVDRRLHVVGRRPAPPSPSTFLCACGERTSAMPAPLRRSPPTRSGISTGALRHRLERALERLLLGGSGAVGRTGSLCGGGTFGMEFSMAAR